MAFLLLATNILVQWQFHFFNFTVTYGILPYSITFLLTDYIGEIYGKQSAKNLVIAGFVFSIIPSLIFSTPQIIIGSMLAYVIAQSHDVWIYDWYKMKTKGRFMWLRNNASTIVSQLLDTIIFSTVAFYGVLDNETILSIIYSEYIVKIIIAVVDTAPLYFLVGLKKNVRINYAK